MRLTTTADRHDLFAAERFLAAEARIATTFGRIEEAVAPLLRAMRATGRTTYATDPERGTIWGHAFLRPRRWCMDIPNSQENQALSVNSDF